VIGIGRQRQGSARYDSSNAERHEGRTRRPVRPKSLPVPRSTPHHFRETTIPKRLGPMVDYQMMHQTARLHEPLTSDKPSMQSARILRRRGTTWHSVRTAIIEDVAKNRLSPPVWGVRRWPCGHDRIEKQAAPLYAIAIRTEAVAWVWRPEAGRATRSKTFEMASQRIRASGHQLSYEALEQSTEMGRGLPQRRSRHGDSSRPSAPPRA